MKTVLDLKAEMIANLVQVQNGLVNTNHDIEKKEEELIALKNQLKLLNSDTERILAAISVLTELTETTVENEAITPNIEKDKKPK